MQPARMAYKEAANILQNSLNKKASVKNLVLSSKYHNKKQLMAIVCETLKYSDVITKIIEATKLQKEKIFKDKFIAMVLVYDFLFGKGMQKDCIWKDAILRHKTALQSELAKMKVKAQVVQNNDLLSSNAKAEVIVPRYVRVNTIKTTTVDVINHFKSEGFTHLNWSGLPYTRYIEAVKDLKPKQFANDFHIGGLLVFAKKTDLHDHVLFKSGEIILQDKASCLPAFILDPPIGSKVIDCCAAPGNKTSHLAALVKNKGEIFAFDKDIKRVGILSTTLAKAGAVCPKVFHQDFLSTNPLDSCYNGVEYALVDPSCTGSGITSRLNEVIDAEGTVSTNRLQNLSKFQAMILKHALSFPDMKRLVYSTCSVHTEENEGVVKDVLKSVGSHFKLAMIGNDLPSRGQEEVFSDAKLCLRLTPTSDLTNGFFIACFERISSKDGPMDIFHQKSASSNVTDKNLDEKSKYTSETYDFQEPALKKNVKNKKKRTSSASNAQGKIQHHESSKHKSRKRKKQNEKVHKDSMQGDSSRSVPQIGSLTGNKNPKKRKRNRKHRPVTMT